MSQETGVEHTKGSIKEYFDIENHIVSTRSADLYSAIDKSRKCDISLWLLRHPLASNSSAVNRFLRRMQMIDSMQPPLTAMTGYGVDNQGTAFAVFSALDGFPINSGNVEPIEAERRFIACVNFIAALHQAGIICGDLCGASFWLKRSGDIEYVGVMGSFDAEATATAMLPPVDTMHFMAPEQRAGAGLEQASDVFALGALGYQLLCKRYPFDAQAVLSAPSSNPVITKPSAIVSAPPVWADEVLMKCLSPNPADRYPSATALLNEIKLIRERALDALSTPARRDSPRSGFLSEGNKLETLAHLRDNLPGEPQPPAPPRPAANAKRRITLVGVTVILIIAGIMGWAYVRKESPLKEENSKLKTGLEPHLFVTSKDLRRAIDGLLEPNSSFNEKKQFIDSIANSNDPVAQDVLLKVATDQDSEALRKVSETAIIDRAKRLGMLRGAEQVKLWLDSLAPQAALPSNYKAMLQSLDNTLPLDARNAALRQAYATNPKVVLRIASGLALDAEDTNQFQEIMSQLVGDALLLDDAEKHSVLALILSSPDLSQLFGDDVIQKRDAIPDKDVLWILDMLSARDDVNVRAVANLAMARGLLPKSREKFLSLVRDRNNLPGDVLRALVHAASGVLVKEDVAAIGRWYDVAVEEVLLSICADDTNPDIAVEAFDTIASKSLQIEPSASLVEWIRDSYWEKRKDFVRIVGMLSHVENYSKEELEKELGVFDKYAKDKHLIEILVGAGNPAITKFIVIKYKDLIGIGRLLLLLNDPNKEVRMIAITSLKDYNDVGALRIIIDAYEREKDPEVKKLYEESFWVIRQRMGG